jgi:hypothetical protein
MDEAMQAYLCAQLLGMGCGARPDMQTAQRFDTDSSLNRSFHLCVSPLCVSLAGYGPQRAPPV